MTCVVCRLTFEGDEEQRAHFKTMLHIENCRRAANQLPPMTADEYCEYLAIQAEQQAMQEYSCHLCGREFKDEEQYEKHLGTAKHEQREKIEQEKEQRICAKRHILVNEQREQEEAKPAGNSEEPAPDEADETAYIEIDAPCFCNYEEAIVFKQLLPQLLTLDEDAQDELIFEEIIAKRPILPEDECLFCEHTNPDFAQLMKHMEEEHGFFVPRAEYADQKGIVKLLQTVFGESRQCIICDRSFFTLGGLQAHMIAKRHSLPDCENFPIMFSEYYDFTPTYPPEMLEEAEGEPEVLELMKQKPFRLERGDFEARFQLTQGGRIFTMKEWYRYRKARVSEWAEIKARQAELVKSLERMGRSAIKETKAGGEGTQIVLSDKAHEIVNQVNELADRLQDRYLLRITDEWLEKQYDTQLNQPQEMLMRFERQEIEARRDVVSEGINHFKKHFKRSTLYMRGDKRGH